MNTIKLTDEQLNDLFNALDYVIDETYWDVTRKSLIALREALNKQLAEQNP